MREDLQEMQTWHEGERRLQERAGAVERMASVGARVVRDFMPDQHRAFYAQLPVIVVGSVDDAGDAWATLLEGGPGFINSPSATLLDIGTVADPRDPAAVGISPGKSIGLLGIELHTRRRNRMNGVVTRADGGIRVEVDQSFGNCPRYIQLRDFTFSRTPGQRSDGALETLEVLDAEARALISDADAFFVASYADREARRQVDVSHRGGKAGFVRVGQDGVLTVPDFDGNLFFSTLGNILLNGKAGLVFVDFATGDLLQMTGDAEIILDSPDIAAFQGAERLWTFTPRRILRRRNALTLRWTFQTDGWSPSSLMTGDWDQAAERLKAAARSNDWRTFAVTRIVNETAAIRSFYLKPADGAGLVPHLAGQHLPILLNIPGMDKPILRTYTLSAAPSDGLYRISVRRDGLASTYLHDAVRVGDVIDARAPAGAFTMDAHATRPAVLLAGGIGITPLLAMLRHVVYEGLRRQRMRPVILLQAARSRDDRAFDAEIAELVDAGRGAIRLVRVLSDTQGAEEGADYDAAGRIDMPLLTRSLPFGDYDFYLCGPPSFTQSLYDGLRSYAVADHRIHAEAFGPSSLSRRADPGPAPSMQPAASTQPVPVLFTASLKEARWTPGSGSLLELAEARGLDPAFSCRAGSCGSCRTTLLAGAVTYPTAPTASIGAGEVLLCSAVPAAMDGQAANRIELAL
ncbi:pyridoxamine 5'-phosphate oxidase family protein [Rhizobium sp. TRM95796]|uniref:2Fe-2S iron-sulfur cluster-binding protein n=1 Tax=Rhizobium sp. TRM95796 TaxID=2979862 RepID=UPI0021E786BD|nr:pyridoxamine 5'-phosphate oxidase family protein [Rhizobium sp. TRM95796]MCV3768915.1 pyridoxamine 5'-phosphate oxidase family protein [Rhizobium sp. TRM95796]